MNTLASHPSNGGGHSPRMSANHRVHPPLSNNALGKTISNSMADLSLSIHSNKTRLTSFPSKLDQYNSESFKKIPLSQSYDWGMLAITNTDLLLLYNKDKSSLVVFDANGNENEVRRDDKIGIHMMQIVYLLENSMVRRRNQRFMCLS